ncbi:MAG: type 4a pilus biogenesis protein PilO [Planctomycetes bacterium]|nr:type 4a pilus biogenesis protein PilO [Planctomycetota bacterium]
MPQGDTTEKTALIITVVVVVILVIGVGSVYFMGRKKLSGIQTQMGGVKNEIKKYDSRIAMIPKLKKEYEDKNKEAEDSEARLPDTDEIDALLRQIEQSAIESRLSVMSFEKGRTKSQRGKGASVQQYETFKYNFEFTGNYENFVEFVHRMEYKMPRHFALVSFSIQGDSDGLVPGTHGHQFKMEFVTYAFNKKVIAASKTSSKKGQGK